MTDRRELENLISGIDEEISDCRRDIKEGDATGDDEVKQMAEEDIAALQDQRQQALNSLDRIAEQ